MRLPAAHHLSTESRFDFVSSSGKKKPHQKTNKRGATICKRKGSTNLETASGFFFFFFQCWVFFRSIREKLTFVVVVVGLQRSEVSEFKVGSLFFFKSD